MSVFCRILLLLCFAFATTYAEAQFCEWLNTSEKTNGEDLYADDSGNVVMIGRIESNTTVGGVALYANYLENSYLVKYDSAGQFLWVIQTTLNASSGANNCSFGRVTGDDSCNYYVVGSSIGSINFGNGVILGASTNQAMRFILKVNSAGIAQWVRGITFTGTAGTMGIAVDNLQQVYVSVAFSGTIAPSGTTSTITSTGSSGLSDVLVLKYATSGAFLWGRGYGGSGTQTTFRTIAVNADRHIYLKLFNIDSWTLGSIPILDTGLLILKLDEHGDPINAKVIKTGNSGGGYIGAFPDGRFAIVGHFNDTLHLSPSIKLIHTGAASASSYVAFFDSSLECKWGIQTQAVDQGSFSFISNPVMRDNGMYFGGRVNIDDVFFGNTRIKVYASTSQTAVMTKLDTLGNILWCFYTGCPSCNLVTYGAGVDRHGDAFFCGNWSDTIAVFTRQATTSSTGFNAFIAKIGDNSIERGPVNSGPYCAGDSIQIPFRTRGVYDGPNEFVAQLSDSAGNFDVSFRELGRVSATSHDTIFGILPLFQVATGANYRIRIVSTYPQVQSYYLRDTLRLLIYSKDSANAGPDRLLCSGEPTTLSTSGGSKWHWSPSEFFLKHSDTAKVSAIIAPDTTTEYRVIISDSSGCGLTDTDYVHVFVRPPLEVSVPPVVKFCILRNAVVTAQGVGGDSSQYHYTWRRDGDPLRTILSTTNVLTVSPFSTRRYWVILTDSCSRFNDSALVTVTPESGVSLTEIPDTTLCYGQSITIDLSSVACDSSAIKYTWDQGLGTGTQKNLSPLLTTDYRIIARDTVDGRMDTVDFRITVLPPLQVSLGNDTSFCKGQPQVLTPNITGGKNSAYQYRWMADTGTGFYFVDTTSSIAITANRETVYQLHVSDQCTSPSDSNKRRISVRDPLELTLREDTLVCQGEEVSLWAQASGGLVASQRILWYDDQFVLLDSGTLVSVIPNGTQRFMAVLSDNCSAVPDTAFVLVDVRDSLAIAPIADQQICYGAEVNIQPVLSGGLTSAYKLFIQNESDLTAVDTAFTFTFTLKPQTTASYVLSLIDGCSKDTAFERFQVEVSAELVAQIDAKDSICSGESINLKSLVSGGLPAFYAMTWLRNDTLQTAGSSNWFDAPNGSSLYVLVMNDGCSEEARDSLYVVVLPAHQAAFTLSDTLGCSPLQLILSDVSMNHDPSKNEWQINGPNFYSEEPELTLTRPGAYDIGLRVSNVLNCSNTFTRKSRVIVYPKPVARFDVRPFARQTDESILFIHTGSGADYFQWNLGDGTTLPTSSDTLSYIYQDSGTYTVEQIAFNAQGCSDTAHYPMTVYLSPFCAIPNAFTVNGDILNETFAPHCSGILSYNMMIMNRWGEILLNCNDCSWDGTYQGEPVPAGVYFYRIEMSSPIEKTFSVGSINLIR